MKRSASEPGLSLDCPRDLSYDIYQKLLIKTSLNFSNIKTGQKAGKREKMSISCQHHNAEALIKVLLHWYIA